MAKGIKVTKSGKEVTTSTSLDDFYIHSSYPLLKVHSSGSFSTGITGLQTIDHDLGYIPFILVFAQYVGADGYDPYITDELYQCDWLQEGATVTFFGVAQAYDDRVEIEIGNTNAARTGVVDGIYYIFKDEVAA